MTRKENLYLMVLLLAVALILAASPLPATTQTPTTATTSGTLLWEDVERPSDLHGQRILEKARCTDSESGEQGRCIVIGVGKALFMVFHDQRGPVFLRRVIPGIPYQTIWHRDRDGPVPSGVPL
jgi:hypothetical protein